MSALRALPLSRLLTLAALITLAAPPAPAQRQRRRPAPRLVESVNVAGNRRLTDAEILGHLETRPGEPYDEARVMRDLRALGDLGVFDRRITRVLTGAGLRGGVEVTFEVFELPVIKSVKFEGLKRPDATALLEGLRRRGLGLDGGSVYEPDRIVRAAGVMKELMRGRGWRGVGVQTRVIEVSSTSVELTFIVSGMPPMNRPRKRLDKFRRPNDVARLAPELD